MGENVKWTLSMTERAGGTKANNLLTQMIESKWRAKWKATQFAEFKIELVAWLMQLEFISCKERKRESGQLIV